MIGSPPFPVGTKKYDAAWLSKALNCRYSGVRVLATASCASACARPRATIAAASPSAWIRVASLRPWAAGDTPGWRDSALMEVDFAHPDEPTRFQRHWSLDANRCHASILREARWKYVQFAGGVPPMLFDLENDPGETLNLAEDPAHSGEISRLARKMIDRMTERRDRRLTGIAIGD